MIPLDLDNIKKHLSNRSVTAEFQKESNQLSLAFKVGERAIPLFIRIYENSELLQFLAFLPCTIISSAIEDTSRRLHLLNKEVDLPGFGMDEDSKLVFYRIMIPSKGKKIDKDIFDALFNATQVVSTSFLPVITSVALGTVTFDDVVTQAKLHNQSVAQSQLKHE